MKNVDFNNIVLGQQIGEGSYGVVFKAEWKTEIAVKRLGKFETSTRPLDLELNYLSQYQHENIVKMFGTTRDKDDVIYILMELAEISLYSMLHEEKCEISYLAKHSWMHQCAKGIAYLHDQNLVHRDIKSLNILLFHKKRILKLCDFGSMRKVSSMMTAETGTPHYMAPEVAYDDKYDNKVDVYSFGVVCWEIMTRKIPFKDTGEERITYLSYEGLRPDVKDVKNWENSAVITKIIEQCWTKDPKERPTMKGLSFTLGLDPKSFGDYRELIPKLRPLPEIDDTCFR